MVLEQCGHVNSIVAGMMLPTFSPMTQWNPTLSPKRPSPPRKNWSSPQPAAKIARLIALSTATRLLAFLRANLWCPSKMSLPTGRIYPEMPFYLLAGAETRHRWSPKKSVTIAP
jgi:hypothetical protein